MSDEEVLHLARVLKNLIRVSGLSAREIERRLGMCGGYLSRLLSGRIEIKVSHIFDILEVVEMYPSEFFAWGFPMTGREPSPMLEKLLRDNPQMRPVFEQLMGRREAGPQRKDDLAEKLAEAIRRVLAEEGERAG